MKKLFAFDLDGTILGEDNSISEFNFNALNLSKKSGNLNVIATGRGISKVLPLFNKNTIHNFDYFVCSNGAVIYDIKNKKTFVLGKLDNAIFDIIREYSDENKLVLTIDSLDYNCTILPESKIPNWLSNENKMDLNILNICNIQDLKNNIENNNFHIVQIATRNPKKLAKKITSEIIKLLDKYKVSIFLTNGVYTDINPLGVNKLKGLEKVLELEGLSHKNLISFGDSGNDIAMLKNANLSFAMGNATDDAKEAASRIIGKNNTNAIGETIIEILKFNNVL
ncbi:Cof-type HAD-IIB family hydrolase [Mycoplasma sp. CSL7491-lung]|uniref:HAD family hydrolase n=1 Tax=Mycoplasma sp. CSL7491-lung TaxID=549718 RepID=UPI001C12170E|nr:HAD family hydrolase [Mycoplasma sp. CSL7491-lung]MBU4693196.1 Cof-type HAD-IIB family hydrolase [Mycoplasma sp. CSL7491-lung]